MVIDENEVSLALQRILASYWSSSYNAGLSLIESFGVLKYFHDVASPAVLCHKELLVGFRPTFGNFKKKNFLLCIAP